MKFLIVRFSSMGDVVLTTPVIRCLKQQVAGAEVHYVTKKTNASLLNTNPYIDKLHVFDHSLREIMPILKAVNFDYVIDLHNNIRSLGLKIQLFKTSFSFHKLNIQKFLLTQFKITVLPKEHVVDRYLKTVQSFGVKNDLKGLDYFIPASEEIDFTIIPSSHQKNYIAFSIGGTYATKRLLVEKMIEICKKIQQPVFLLGGKEDKPVADQVTAALGSKIYNGCGVFSIHQSASVIKHANWVITHDTAMMHIASAFHKNIVSVWGNTIPEFGMSPYLAGSKSQVFEVKALSCRPCSKIGFDSCPKKHFDCMQKIDTFELASYINQSNI